MRRVRTIHVTLQLMKSILKFKDDIKRKFGLSSLLVFIGLRETINHQPSIIELNVGSYIDNHTLPKNTNGHCLIID